MATQKAIEDASEPSKKNKRRNRKVIKLDTKIEIIRRLENGESSASLGRAYNVNESTIRSIKRSSESIKNSIAQSNVNALKKTSRVRNPLIEKMETMLGNWVDLQNENMVRINSITIREKALKIYKLLQAEDVTFFSTEQFLASKGWFDNFRKRQNLHLIRFKDSGNISEYAPNFKKEIKTESYAEPKILKSKPTVENIPSLKIEECQMYLVNPTADINETPEFENSEEHEFDDSQDEKVFITRKNKISVNDLMKIRKKSRHKEQKAVEPRQLTIKNLSNFLSLADQLAKKAVEIDPNTTRSLKFGKELNSILTTYREFFAEKQTNRKRSCMGHVRDSSGEWKSVSRNEVSQQNKSRGIIGAVPGSR